MAGIPSLVIRTRVLCAVVCLWMNWVIRKIRSKQSIMGKVVRNLWQRRESNEKHRKCMVHRVGLTLNFKCNNEGTDVVLHVQV